MSYAVLDNAVTRPDPARRGAGLAARQIAAMLFACLAALALGHGCCLCSTDADFARFPGIHWTNPIAG